MSRVLVVEDEPSIARALRMNLAARQYDVDLAADGATALGLAARHRPDLVILDLGLPDMAGTEVIHRLREWSPMPVLVLSARDGQSDKVEALDAGADDYLTKPFLVEELVLRVRGIMRRAEWSQTPARTGPVVKFGESEVDMDTMRASTPEGAVALTEREVMLVRFFSENEGRVLTRGELLERVWGYTFDTSTRTLDTFIHRLRKHFEKDPRNPLHFHTVRGVGYRFTSEPEE